MLVYIALVILGIGLLLFWIGIEREEAQKDGSFPGMTGILLSVTGLLILITLGLQFLFSLNWSALFQGV